ncbi:uncharacterized protein FTOL_09233 [Fusarium torulosum]|uniref:Uncharacterized protein n=1 Tax=Fusarium torulosum TaxID=33205 RepID=A0AAE8SKW5_9HYPO|nr:uncharacterized protein FTOL_09233 [Fusarium torulosum]
MATMGLFTAGDWDSAPPYQLGLRPNLCIPYAPQSASLPYQLASGKVFYLDTAYTVWCHRVGQVLSTLRLARPLLRGNETTRAAYQAPAIIRPILAVIAVVGKDPDLHGAVVKLLHAFLYARLLIFASKRIRLTKVQSQATIYAQAVFLGAILAIQASGLPGGVAVYIGAYTHSGNHEELFSNLITDRETQQGPPHCLINFWCNPVCGLAWLSLKASGLINL